MREYLKGSWAWVIGLLTLATMLFFFSAEASFDRLSPILQSVVESRDGSVIHPSDVSKKEVDVFIRGNVSKASIESLGGVVRTIVGEIITAKVPVSKLRAIADLPGVQYVQASMPCKPTLDISTSNSMSDSNFLGIDADAVQSTYDGTDVIVGVVDTGIDWDHGDFIDDTDSTSRILYIWDQTLTPQGGESNPSGYDYGVEYTKSQIDDEIDGTPTGFVRERDTEGHGTHVAGIAAGDGSDTDGDEPAGKYKGVAPDADLIIVKTDFYSTHIVDGVNYIISKAQSLGRPVVVNLSLGRQYGPHDGTSEFETAISSFCGTGKMVVVSAGNKKGKEIHAEGVYSGSSVSTSFYVKSGAKVGIDIWHDGGDGYTCTVQGPGVGPISANHGQYISSSSISIWNATSTPPNGDNEIVIHITNPPVGSWSITLSNRNPSSGSGEFDMWIYEPSDPSEGSAYFTSNVSEDEIVGEPGNAQNCLTVGSYNTKYEWDSENGFHYWYEPPITLADISSFSSEGPTRDGRLKPEIAAPGKGIVSSLSTDSTVDVSWIVKDGRHCIKRGTSMAAPHVAGAVALIYDKYPSASVSQVRNWILNTARSDTYASGLPNNTWGYGKLNVPDMLDATLPVTLTSVEAAFDGSKVILIWHTETEVENVGFNIYRSDSKDGRYEKIGWVDSKGALIAPNDYLFTDEDVVEGRSYFYYIESVELSGKRSRSDIIQVVLDRQTPAKTALLQNYPNPFNPETWIPFKLSEEMDVVIEIYDLSGKMVRKIDMGHLKPGYYISKDKAAHWDGRNENGERVASGTYIYRLKAERNLTRKMTVLK